MADDSPSTIRIQQCIDRLQMGDPQAREELIGAACERLKRLTRKMLRSYPRVKRWDETDDVFQGATMRLYRSLEQAVPKTPADFFRLASLNIRRELLDLVKHYYGPAGAGAHHATLHRAADDENHEDATQRKSDTTREPGRLAAWGEFHEQIDALPDIEREIFDLLWYQGLTQAQAAEILKVTERTVKRRWQSARLALFEALHGELPGT